MTNFTYYKEQFDAIYGDSLLMEHISGKCFTVQDDLVIPMDSEKCEQCMFHKDCSKSVECGEDATGFWLSQQRYTANDVELLIAKKIKEIEQIVADIRTLQERAERGEFK